MKEKITEIIKKLFTGLAWIIVVVLGIIVLFSIAKECGKPIAEMPGYCIGFYGR